MTPLPFTVTLQRSLVGKLFDLRLSDQSFSQTGIESVGYLLRFRTDLRTRITRNLFIARARYEFSCGQQSYINCGTGIDFIVCSRQVEKLVLCAQADKTCSNASLFFVLPPNNDHLHVLQRWPGAFTYTRSEVSG